MSAGARGDRSGVQRIAVARPWFEDLKRGQVFEDAPAVTLTHAHAAFHQALFGDRMRLPLDAPLCLAVTGCERPLVHPGVVCNFAIGASTSPTQRVRGNLFYRGLVLQRPVFVGDTLGTRTEVVALRQNRPKPGRAATGMVVLQIHVENDRGETVLHFWRCAMIPCRDPRADTGHADSFDAIPEAVDLDRLRAAVPASWRLDRFRARGSGPHFADLAEGQCYAVEARDTVTGATELTRLTLNLAEAHTDAGSSPYARRLVYGGHTISMAAAQVTRALPDLVTWIAWRSCDHTAPVFEGDVLQTDFDVDALHPLEGGGGLVELRARVRAERGPEAPEPGETVGVLDWRFLALLP